MVQNNEQDPRFSYGQNPQDVRGSSQPSYYGASPSVNNPYAPANPGVSPQGNGYGARDAQAAAYAQQQRNAAYAAQRAQYPAGQGGVQQPVSPQYYQDQQQVAQSPAAAYSRSQANYGQVAAHRAPIAGANANAASPYGAPMGSAMPPASAYVPASFKPVEEPRSAHGHPVLMTIVGLLIGLIVGALAMFFISRALSGAPTPVAGTLQESQLDTVVGTYRYQDDTYKITARDAILGTKSLESARNADGSYQTPSSDMIISFARNDILARLVRDNGIEVSSEEVAAYARDLVGTDDMNAVASYFSMDVDQAQRIVSEAAAVRKLREQVVGSSATALQPPAYPADGATEVGTADYATYIIGLLGSNWDSASGTWANTSNPYYDVLKDKVFAPGSASYDAAQAAYAVALEQTGATDGAARSAWTSWLNQYLDEGSIAVATLRA